MSNEEDLANALFNANRIEDKYASGTTVTTTLYGTAVSDSVNGRVSVILDGDVSATYADGSMGSSTLNLPTVPNVVKGDKVIIQCVGTTAKTMTVIGVVGSGDRTHILAIDADAESAKARKEAAEAQKGAEEAQKQLDAYVEQAKAETEALQKECDAAQAAADAAQAEAEAQTAKIQALVEDGEKKQAQIDANTAQAAIDQERTNCNNDMFQTSAKNIIDAMGNQGSLKASTGQLIFTASSAQPTASHTGDLWLDTANSAAYKWDGSAWVALDGDTAKDDTDKLIVAANVEGSPFKVFTATPTTPYKVGDLYLTDIEKGDIYRCIKAREEGDYSADDWCVTSSYDSAMSQLMRALDAGKANLETKAKELKAKADDAYAEADALGQVATNKYQVEYIQTDSATTKPSQDAEGWSTTAPTRTEGKYIWMRSTYYIGTGEHAQLTHSEPSCITGDAGKDGTGKDGVSVTGSDTFYILATSQPTTPTGAADPSGWSKTEPTPADDYTGNEYRCIRTKLSDGTALWTTPTVVASFSFAQKAYKTATGTAEKWRKIDKTVEEYNSTYGTSYDTIDGVLLKMSSSIKQNSDGIELKADSSTVTTNNMMRGTAQFAALTGGKWTSNAIRVSGNATLAHDHDSSCPVPDSDVVTITATNAGSGVIGGFAQDAYPSVSKGQAYTMSCYVYASTACTVRLQPMWWGGITSDYSKDFSVEAGEWTKLTHTWTSTADKTSVSIGYVYIVNPTATGQTLKVCGLKVEKGSKATDWCGANEELTTSAQLKVESNRITEEVKGTYATKEGVSTLSNTVTSLDSSTTRRFESLKGAITEWIADPDFKQGSANVDGWRYAPASGGMTQSVRDNPCDTGEWRQLSKGTVIRAEATVNCASMADGVIPRILMNARKTKTDDNSYWPVMAEGTRGSKTTQKLFGYYTVPDAYDGWWFYVNVSLHGSSTSSATGSVTWTHVRVTDVTSATEDSTLIHQTSDGVAVGTGTQAADGTVTWASDQFHTLQGNGTFQVVGSDGKTVYTSIGAGTATIGQASGYNTNITGDAVRLCNGSTALAQVSGSTATIGPTSGLNTCIDGNGIYMRNGTTKLAQWNASSLLLGQTSGTYTYNLLADSSGLYLRNGTTQLAKLQTNNLTMGDTSGVHAVVNTSGMTIYDGSGNNRASYTGTGVRLGLESGIHTNFTNSWMSFYNGTDEVGWFGASSAQIGSSSTSSTLKGYNTRADAEGVKLRVGTSNRLLLNGTGLYIYDTFGKQYTAVEAGQATLGNPGTYNLKANSNGLLWCSGTTENAKIYANTLGTLIEQSTTTKGEGIVLSAKNGVTLDGYPRIYKATATRAANASAFGLKTTAQIVSVPAQACLYKGSATYPKLSSSTSVTVDGNTSSGVGITWGTPSLWGTAPVVVSGFACFHNVPSGTNCLLGICDQSGTIITYQFQTSVGEWTNVTIAPYATRAQSSHDTYFLFARVGGGKDCGYIAGGTDANKMCALTVTG